jgi:hypothetical protein
MTHKVEVEFSAFGWEILTEEAGRAGASIDELVLHATMHYLAGADHGHLSHRVPRRRPPSLDVNVRPGPAQV